MGLFEIFYKIFSKGSTEKKQKLSVEKKITINIGTLINLVGKENIIDCSSTHTKIKLNLKETTNINLENIKKIKGISGIFATSKSITLVVGKSAKTIENKIKDSFN